MLPRPIPRPLIRLGAAISLSPPPTPPKSPAETAALLGYASVCPGCDGECGGLVPVPDFARGDRLTWYPCPDCGGAGYVGAAEGKGGAT